MYWRNNRKTVASMVLFLAVLLLAACSGTYQALEYIKSSDIQTCQKGMDTILLESDDEGIRGMEAAVKSGEANTQEIVDRLLTIENDKSLSDEFNGKAHDLLLDIFYGEMGDTALQIFENDPRNAIMFDSIFEDINSIGDFRADRDYIIQHLANITTPAIVSKLLDNYMAPVNTGVSDNISDIFKQSKLNDTFLNYWPAYYETNGLDKIVAGRMAINNAFQNIPLNGYENILNNLYEIYRDSAAINNMLIEDHWDGADIKSLDSNKVAIFEIQEKSKTGTPAQFSWSPYSFILVPKEKCLSAESLYNAGTVICIHRTVQYCGIYTPMGIDPSIVEGGGVKAYSQSVTITKADRINKDVTIVRILEGVALGDEINAYVDGNIYMAPPPAEEDIIQTLQQGFEEIEAYYDFNSVVKDVELDSLNVRYNSVVLDYRDKEAEEFFPLELICYRPLGNYDDEEQYLSRFRSLTGAVDIMINGHKALKQEVSYNKCNLYFWVEDGTGMVLNIPFWLLERYPEEIFFDIQKVEVNNRIG